MQSVEEIINEQYKDLAKKFKPCFGNQKHIDIINDMRRMAGMEKILVEKLAASKGSTNLRNETKLLKRNLLNQMKNL